MQSQIRSEIIQKTASALLHPLSLLAVFLLLLNDHLLRRLWPSWLTGKLGDFAWLFFFPFVVLLLLVWLIPGRLYRRKNALPLAAFALVGGVFALGKTVPFCHRLLVQALETLLQMPIGLRLDPSDLIALPALLAAWHLWQHAPRLPAARLRLAWVILPVCALLTIANSAAPDKGIFWVGIHDGRVYAASSCSTQFVSQDGGETWQTIENLPEGIQDGLYGCAAYDNFASRQWETLEDPSRPGMLLRYKPDEDIQSSSDGGKTWQSDFALHPISQAQQAYYRKTQDNAFVSRWPADAVADPTTKNVIFAMGWQGILVRRGDGSYQAVAVGSYAPTTTSPLEMLWVSTSGEMLLAFLLGGLGIIALNLHLQPSRFKWLLSIMLYIGWAVVLFVFSPALMSVYELTISNLGIILLFIFWTPLVIDSFLLLGHRYGGKANLHNALILAGCALVFFFPFALWSQNVISKYYLAAIFGIALAAGLLVWYYMRMQRVLFPMWSAAQEVRTPPQPETLHQETGLAQVFEDPEQNKLRNTQRQKLEERKQAFLEKDKSRRESGDQP